MHDNKGLEKDLPPYGVWYISLSRKILRSAGPSEADKERKREETRTAFETADVAANEAFEKVNEARIRGDDTTREFRRAESKYKEAKKKMEKAEAVFKQEKFRAAVDFLSWDIDEFDVMAVSQIMTMIVFAINAVATIPIFMIYGATSLMYAIPFVFIFPLIVLGFFATYPENLAQRVRIQSLGRAPEAINYLVMSMRLSPTLDKAIMFTGNHTDEPLASEFKKLTWDLMMRKYNNIEDGLVDFASRWGQWNEDFRRALYAIRTATLERTEEGLKRTLDKANDIILTGTKTRMEGYAASLSGPTMIVFALGVLLPLIMGSMLPMLSMNMGDMMNFDATGMENTLEAGDSVEEYNIMPIVLLLDVVFPVITLVYSYYVLGNRPGTTSPPDIKSPFDTKQKRTIGFAALLITICIGAFGLPVVYEKVGIDMFGVTPLVVGISVGASFYLVTTTRYQKKKRDETKKLEAEFPDALFQLGSRISEGEPLESAFQKVADTLKGTMVAELFATISYNLKMTRAPLNEILFNRNIGVLKDVPSRTIRATMETVVEAVQKDASTAGQTIVTISNYLRDMIQVDQEIKNSLSSVVDMMKTTAILFAPIVMGITIGLYFMLYNQFQDLPFTSSMMDPSDFVLIIGVYLLMVVGITGYFAVGIQNGIDTIEAKYSIGISLPVAAITFSIVTILSQSLMGG